ncbi:uncharacterized protein LOC135682200 isoform X2 [Rhopilema esculentum]|uniref:uncharacterized protein LOC135682200 isoform X2 n=1 Tax=Rhopilema esculentum TaxID=499914 RepID=UPI0031E26FD3
MKPETFVQIEVRNPRTHISREKALYTDYEIVVKTNNIAFACTESTVRRRYSEFQWLRTRLMTHYKWVTCPPELPPKRLFGRFQRQFLKRRQQGLQKFILRVVEDNQYLSDVAVHLFLQSSLPIKEIERYLDGMVSDGEILNSYQSPGKGKHSGLSRSMAEIPHEIETHLEHDSGFCYSTTSSINDLMYTSVAKSRAEWKDFVSMPANLDKVTTNEEIKTDQPNARKLSQVDSGHVTFTGSHMSLQRTARSSESDSDFLFSVEYDADDESDHCCLETIEGVSMNLHYSQTFSIEQALDILRTRTKISDRIQLLEDTDEEFHESEYDVIDSENEENERKSISSIKKKLSRSLSDAKLKRRSSRSSLNERKKPMIKGAFQSMPNMQNTHHRHHTRAKAAGGIFMKKLESHQEDPEVGKGSAKGEGFSTSSSISKYRSDDADESYVPNSEMDCYSTWNSPSKIVNGNVDSSEIEASFEKVPEIRSAARSLFKRIISKREKAIKSADAPLISGRFRVSVIREEGSSRRGSASSNELTLRRSPVREVVKKASQLVNESSVRISEQQLWPQENLAYSDRNIADDEDFLTVPKIMDIISAPLDFPDASDSEKPGEIAEGKEEGYPDSQSPFDDFKQVPSLVSLVSALLGMEETNVNNRPKTTDTPTEKSSTVALQNDESIQELAVKHPVNSEVLDSERPCIMDQAEDAQYYKYSSSFIKDLSAQNNFNVLGLNGNLYTDHQLQSFTKQRPMSPTPALLNTYDVIPDAITTSLEDYAILGGKRD